MIRSLQARCVLIGAVLLVSLFFVYPSVGPVPEFWAKYLPNSPIRLGLDLQGGLYLVLEVDADKAVEAQVDQAVTTAAGVMKDEKIRYSDVLRTSGTGLVVYLKDEGQSALFDDKVLNVLSSFKKVSSGPSDKGFAVKLELDAKTAEETKHRAVRQAVDTIRNRVDAMGVTEPDVVIQGTDRVVVQLPGLKEDTDRAKEVIKRAARLEFKIVDDKGSLEDALKGDIPPGDEILYEMRRNPTTGALSRTPRLLKKQILLTGDTVIDARVQPGQMGRMEVSLEFNRMGSDQFARITTEHVRQQLAIILDNVVYSAPVINEPITGGHARISGMFTPEEAHDLALVLRSGSLPAPVKVIEERSVGPSLGEDSIRSGRNAIILGIVLITIGMIIYYKWSGVVADIALVTNLLLILGTMASPPLRATLTLPGLAGVALTIGMAIDANILIFERAREELRMGKSGRAALDAGYHKAFLTIIDTHITNILAVLPLIQFGTGPVKGFAVTLCIGLIISLFTAFFMTRTIFDYAFQVKHYKNLSI